METNNTQLRSEATKEWNKLIDQIKKNRNDVSQRAYLKQELDKWFDNSASKFCDGGRYIVYAAFAFCWSGVLGVGFTGFEKDCTLCSGIIFGLIYLAADMLRNLFIAEKSRCLTNDLNDKNKLNCMVCKMNSLSDITKWFMRTQFIIFIILVLIMGIFLFKNI